MAHFCGYISVEEILTWPVSRWDRYRGFVDDMNKPRKG